MIPMPDDTKTYIQELSKKEYLQKIELDIIVNMYNKYVGEVNRSCNVCVVRAREELFKIANG